jgi:hypothetical protein
VNAQTRARRFLSRPILLVSVILFSIRVFPLLQKPSLWAEDANVYFSPLITSGPSESATAFNLYANQYWVILHFLARGIYAFAQFDIRTLPFLSSLVSILITLGVASAWLRSNQLVARKRNRELIFGFVLLAPSSWESLGNLANTYVYLFVAVVAISGWEYPRKRRFFLLENFFLSLLALTSISAIFIVFASMFRVILNKKNKYIYVPFYYLIFVLAQFGNWTQRGPLDNSINPIQTVENASYILIKRVFAEVIIGQNGGNFLTVVKQWNGWFTWLLVAFVPIAFLLYALAKSYRYSDLNLFLKMSAIALPTFVHFSLFIFASIGVGLDQLFLFGSGGRYLLFTHILVFVLLIVLLEKLEKFMTIQKFRRLFAVFLIIWTTGLFADFTLNSKTNPDFQNNWKTFAECINTSQATCVVTVPPGGSWGMSR